MEPAKLVGPRTIADQVGQVGERTYGNSAEYAAKTIVPALAIGPNSSVRPESLSSGRTPFYPCPRKQRTRNSTPGAEQTISSDFEHLEGDTTGVGHE